MVVLRLGGVYADIDTECKRPLDSIIRSRDTLIVGWENEFPDAQKALDAWCAWGRRRRGRRLVCTAAAARAVLQGRSRPTACSSGLL